MLILAAAAAIAASSPPPSRTAAPAVQATATVRILSGARLSLGTTGSGEGFSARAAVVRTGGSSQPAMLIEFE
jgi:hypothetical protein